MIPNLKLPLQQPLRKNELSWYVSREMPFKEYCNWGMTQFSLCFACAICRVKQKTLLGSLEILSSSQGYTSGDSIFIKI